MHTNTAATATAAGGATAPGNETISGATTAAGHSKVSTTPTSRNAFRDAHQNVTVRAGTTHTEPHTANQGTSDVSDNTSDFVKFFNSQKNSFLSLFNSSQGSQVSAAPSWSSSSASRPPPPSAFNAERSSSAHTPTTRETATTYTTAAGNAETENKGTAASAASYGLPPGTVDENTLKDFFSYFAIPGMYTEADTVIQRHAEQMGMAATLEDLTNTHATPAPVVTAATAQPPPSPPSCQHVHQLRPTQFFVPTLCEVCRRGVLDTKVWPPPSSPASQAAPSFFSKLLTSPTSTELDTTTTTAAAVAAAADAAAKTSSSSTENVSPQSAASPVTQPFLGFGSEGYHCEVCNLALHRQCLKKLRETQPCEVLAPAAHHIPDKASSLFSRNSAGKTTSASSKEGSDDSSDASSSSSSSTASFTWDSAKSLLSSYLDPNGDTYSRKDANVKLVLTGVFALLDTVAARYPNVTPMTFVKRRQAIQDLSHAHQTLYADCSASLHDSDLLDTISWDVVQQAEQRRTAGQEGSVAFAMLTREMHPMKMDTSLFSQLTSGLTGSSIGSPGKASRSSDAATITTTTIPNGSGEESSSADLSSFFPSFSSAKKAAQAAKAASTDTAGPGANFPVQLLLWRGMRYATAVYGEVYRRGSLSSTVSAALLFTVNRGSTDVAKEVNDSAVTSLLELPPSALRLSRWAAKATEPSYVLLLDHAVGHIVVAFRGTLNTFDIMTDLAAVGIPFCGGYAHQGAAHVVNTLFDHRASHYTAPSKSPPPPPASSSSSAGTEKATDSAASGVKVTTKKDSEGKVKMVLEPYNLKPLESPDGLLDGIEQLAAEYPTYTILITGHSLGGGVAVLFATRLHHDRIFPESVLRRVHVIAYAPMPTLSLPAAACFDAVSCEQRDGGFSQVGDPAAVARAKAREARQEREAAARVLDPKLTLPTRQIDPAHAASPSKSGSQAGSELSGSDDDIGGKTDEVRQACFPVWNVVNGFDCVPRLQVNTIDRLLRHIVGPQVALSDAAQQQQGQQQQQQGSSRASALEMRQRCRGEGRDSAWVEVERDPAAVEMTDVTAQPGEKSAAAKSAKEPPSSSHGPPSTAASSMGAKCCAEEARVTMAESEVCFPAAANTAEGDKTRETTAAATGAPVTGTDPLETKKRDASADEPAWANAARAHLGISDTASADDVDVVVVKPRPSRTTETTNAHGNGAESISHEAGVFAPLKDSQETSQSLSRASSSYASGMPDLSQELHHPGRVLLLTAPWDTTQNRLVDVPRGHPIMHELFLMKYMLLQHANDAYCTSLVDIHRRSSC